MRGDRRQGRQAVSWLGSAGAARRLGRPDQGEARVFAYALSRLLALLGRRPDHAFYLVPVEMFLSSTMSITLLNVCFNRTKCRHILNDGACDHAEHLDASEIAEMEVA